MVSTASRVALFLLTLSGSIVMADMAMAAKIVPISGKHSKDEIKKTCDKAGGEFGEDSGGYGCTTQCTTKESCHVACSNNGKCKGQVPARVQTRSPVMGTAGIEQVLKGQPARSSPGLQKGG
jgi:hypothetical protein